MEEIKLELIILEKSFPFIDFSYFNNSNIVIRIIVNAQKIINNKYTFQYNRLDKVWYIRAVATQNFDIFLDYFITGLIKNNLY